jgi:hypothetical protein
MIIEKFHRDTVRKLYQRFAEKGRMLPAGVRYINSWINEEVSICYQLMETENIEGLHEWISRWDDLCDFEIVPVISSEEAKAKLFS